MNMGRYSYKGALLVLEEFSLSEGYSVDLSYSGISHIHWLNNTLNSPNGIKISMGNYEEQTYIFLHELGHHQLRKDWIKF